MFYPALRVGAAACAAVVLVVCPAVRADIIFQDNFDGYIASGALLNWNGGGTWTVSSGTVDLIGVGSSWNWFPSHGHYVDIDGSTTNAGEMLQTTPKHLGPGKYRLSFDLAGSQRPSYGTSDQIAVEVKVGVLDSATYTLGAYDPFSTYVRDFVVTGAPVDAQISFVGIGGDNVGVLLDNVKLEAIPAPGAALLVVTGIGFIGWLKKRSAA